jgi:sulfoxide reductase heme-binding subunit YedZ
LTSKFWGVKSAETLTHIRVERFVFAASLASVAYLAWAFANHELGVDSYQGLTRETGYWALRFLCLTLAVTPVRYLTGWHFLIRWRRLLGLFAFFYGAVHFAMYVVFDRFAALDFPDGIASWTTLSDLTTSTGSDILRRPFLTIGLIAFVGMAPLAVTSTPAMIRRLGGRRWQQLHHLVYF